ncbi:MAG: DUF447 domain-containing protein [Promethearchaeota archaeon]
MIPVIPSSLRRMGFIPGTVVETILSTIASDGTPNVAPMGVWVQPGVNLVIRPYAETQTARNLQEVPEAVINITDDSRIFFNTAFKRRDTEVDAFFFDPAKSVRPPRLRGMLGYIEVDIEEPLKPREVDNPLEYECRVKEVEASPRLPQVHSRARLAAIECVIHATRIVALSDSDPDLTEKLYDLIKHYHRLVHRIAPSSVHAGVVDDVLYLVERLVYWL